MCGGHASHSSYLAGCGLVRGAQDASITHPRVSLYCTAQPTCAPLQLGPYRATQYPPLLYHPPHPPVPHYNLDHHDGDTQYPPPPVTHYNLDHHDRATQYPPLLYHTPTHLSPTTTWTRGHWYCIQQPLAVIPHPTPTLTTEEPCQEPPHPTMPCLWSIQSEALSPTSPQPPRLYNPLHLFPFPILP